MGTMSLRNWQFLIKLNMHLSHELAVLLPDIYPREVKTLFIESFPYEYLKQLYSL